MGAAGVLSLASRCSPRTALALVALRVAALRGLCGPLRSYAEARAAAAELRLRTRGALPPWPLPAREPPGFREELAVDRDSLTLAAEALAALALGAQGRRRAGVYYTPPALAVQVVEIALRQGSVAAAAAGRPSIGTFPESAPPPSTPLVLDPCAGAGAFLVAAARCGLGRFEAIDLDADALCVARAALALEGTFDVTVLRGDSLRTALAPADLLVSNPPYGHLDGAKERAKLAALFPALRGGEVDRYTGCVLRSIALVREGGTAALLIPDTWMSNARSGPLRAAILGAAEIAAVVDLGKPFAAAKDTRVQALVLVRRAPTTPARATQVARLTEGALVALAPAAREELARDVRVGWRLYRSHGERALCAAMDDASVPLGRACEVLYGLRTGDNARHVERRAPRPGELGLVGGEDILPYGLRWRPKTLVVRDGLEPRIARQLGRERVAIQRIRTNAQAPWARWLEAAIVPRDLVCLDSLSTLACDDLDRLWALLALASSVALNRYHRLRTTDVNVKPSSLRELPVPRRLLEDPRPLARLARRRAASGDASIERRIDALVYGAFGLAPELVDEAECGFWGNRFIEERQRLETWMSDPLAMVVGEQGDTP